MKKNKENIPDSEPFRALASNKAVQTSSIQEKKYSQTSNSDKCQVAIMNYIQSYEGKNYTVFDCPHYTYSSYSKQALEYRIVKYKKYFYKVC